jgi:hypothetical protein
MASLPVDPLLQCGIREFGVRLRRGAVSCESVSAIYRQRIAALDARLGAFTYVPPGQALSAARAIDTLLAAGTDLGPLRAYPSQSRICLRSTACRQQRDRSSTSPTLCQLRDLSCRR